MERLGTYERLQAEAMQQAAVEARDASHRSMNALKETHDNQRQDWVDQLRRMRDEKEQVIQEQQEALKLGEQNVKEIDRMLEEARSELVETTEALRQAQEAKRAAEEQIKEQAKQATDKVAQTQADKDQALKQAQEAAHQTMEMKKMVEDALAKMKLLRAQRDTDKEALRLRSKQLEMAQQELAQLSVRDDCPPEQASPLEELAKQFVEADDEAVAEAKMVEAKAKAAKAKEDAQKMVEKAEAKAAEAKVRAAQARAQAAREAEAEKAEAAAEAAAAAVAEAVAAEKQAKEAEAFAAAAKAAAAKAAGAKAAEAEAALQTSLDAVAKAKAKEVDLQERYTVDIVNDYIVNAMSKMLENARYEPWFGDDSRYDAYIVHTKAQDDQKGEIVERAWPGQGGFTLRLYPFLNSLKALRPNEDAPKAVEFAELFTHGFTSVIPLSQSIPKIDMAGKDEPPHTLACLIYRGGAETSTGMEFRTHPVRCPMTIDLLAHPYHYALRADSHDHPEDDHWYYSLCALQVCHYVPPDRG